MEHVQKLIEMLFGRIERTTVKDTVIGESIVINGKTVVPLFEMSVGVAGGGFMGEGEGGGKDDKRGVNGQCRGEGKGGGTGGGLKVTPAALLTVNSQGSLEVYTLCDKKGWSDKLPELVPQAMEKLKPDNSGK